MSAAKHAIVMNRAEAGWFADLALSASSRDDITPVICGALIEVDGAEARVTCTDRYRAHTGIVKLDAKAKKHTILVPRAGLLWLKKNRAFHGRYQADLNRVTIASVLHGDPEKRDTVTITVAQNGEPGAAGVTWSGELTRGNFPPIQKLIFEARDAEPDGGTRRLNLDFLAAAKVLSGQREPVRFKFTAGSRPDKPGPVYLAWDAWNGELRAEGIIQPNTEVPA